MGSNHNWVRFSILLFLIISITPNFVFPDIQEAEEPLVFEGEFTIDCRTYHYQWTYSHVRVLAENGTEAFSWEVEDRDTIIKGVDYSRLRREFVIFTETFDPEARVYSLAMRGESVSVLVTDRSIKPSYSPVVMDEAGEPEVIVYIEEGGTLVTFDPMKRQVIEREYFGKPIVNIGKQAIEGALYLTVTLYHQEITYPFKRRFQRTASPKQPHIPLELPDASDSALPSEDDGDDPPIRFPLDPKKILGFGDSITYGVMDGNRDPSLGYVPRLERMANRDFFIDGNGTVINEGNPAETIHGYKEKRDDEKNKYATYRYKQVLEEHLAKYLLLHEGTNDTRFYRYDVQLVYDDLEWMVGLALGMGIKPILSTLIPKDIDKYPDKVTPLQLERGRKISVFIQSLGEKLDLPLVDFWEIFSNHPIGYKNLMSDWVHPNEMGYQVMAEEWFKALPPAIPTGLEVVEITPSQITIQWSENTEADFSHYLLEYGFSAGTLDYNVEVTDLGYTFYYNIMQSPFRSRVYFRLKAVDKAGSKSEPTEIQSAPFALVTQ
jgi:lysophospholipase L1-like esterase